jgi:hypothetical protein
VKWPAYFIGQLSAFSVWPFSRSSQLPTANCQLAVMMNAELTPPAFRRTLAAWQKIVTAIGGPFTTKIGGGRKPRHYDT